MDVFSGDVIGIDTETVDGYCRLIADSQGNYQHVNSFCDVANFLTGRRFRGNVNLFYNVRYDFQSVIKWIILENDERLARTILQSLWHNGMVSYRGWTIHYIPEKFFALEKAKHIIRFFDIAQFYEHMRLDDAAQKYLGQKKHLFDVENLTVDKLHSKQAVDYCIQDARLTSDLGILFLQKMNSIGLECCSLFSAAYLSERWFERVCDIPRFDMIPKGAIIYAMRAYRGGWFETVKRGYFPTAYLYDINSAYPDKIAGLIDISRGEWVYSKKVRENADYGYIRCKLHVPFEAYLSPFCYRVSNLSVYPSGYFERVLTLEEYKYIRELTGWSVQPYEGWFFIANKRRLLFRDAVAELYRCKLQYKKNDAVMYLVVKRLLNSLYGKFWQRRMTHDNLMLTGNLFCPCYASEITSRTRLQVARAITHPQHVIAIATDSILSRRKLDLPLSDNLGGWSMLQGKVVSIMSGMYNFRHEEQIIRKARGFEKRLDFFKLGKKYSNKNKIPVDITRVISLGTILQHVKKRTLSDLNLFENKIVEIDINGDSKRLWPKTVTLGDLLTTSQDSMMLSVNDTTVAKRRHRKKGANSGKKSC